MLKPTQISKFSQSARLFFISGSRSAAPDGSLFTCSEDEIHLPRNQESKNDIPFERRPSTLVFKSLDKARTPDPSSGEKAVTNSQARNDVQVLSVSAQVPSVSSSTPTSGGEHSIFEAAPTSQDDMVDFPSDVVDHFVKAGVVAVSFITDLVNCKLPTLDASGVFHTSENSVIDSSSPISNIRAAYVKPHSRKNVSKVVIKPSCDVAAGDLSSVTPYSDSKVKTSGSVKRLDHDSGKSTAYSSGTRNIASESKVQKYFQPSPKTYGSVPNPNSSRYTTERCVTGTTEGTKIGNTIQKPVRGIRKTTGILPLGKQLANSRLHVERVLLILKQLKWGPAAEQALKSLNCHLDAYQANQILKQLQDHSVALDFFYWLRQQAGFRHDEHSYTTMIGILGRARQFGAMNRLLDEMARDGCSPNVVTYNRVIHSYGRANYMGEAVKVFYEMQEIGCKPDRVTYCTLIDIHAKAGFLDVAMDMYSRMQKAGLLPDTFTYSVMINCLGKAGHLDAANKLFTEMVSQGCVPNLVTYNIMIALHAKTTNYAGALKLYHNMKAAGFHPDKVTYSIIMEVYGHSGYLEDAEAVFAEMKWNNWIPDEPVYGLLVDLWGKAGNAEKARAWYQAMLDAGVRPNVPTSNSLLSAFLRVHRFADAYVVLQSMLEVGLKPSLQTYTLLLSCCTETESHADMIFCSKLMTITGHPAHTFLTSMPAAGPDGQNVRDHASNFLDLMHSEDRECKRGLMDSVINFLHKTGLKEEASSVWEVAAQRNVYPDALREKSSCYWLINLHVMSDGTAVIALSRTLAWFRKKILSSGVGPNRIDIVTGWGRRSRVMGSSLVRQSVQELLDAFGFPFYTENGNSGCFVGRGEALGRWLLNPYVERMHLI